MEISNHINTSTDQEHTRRLKLHGNHYHFDDTKRDRPGELFRVIGQVHGDWLNEYHTVKDQSIKEIWGTREESPDIIYMYALSEHTPTLNKIIDIFKFSRLLRADIQIQNPGCVVTKHLDDFTVIERQHSNERVVRFLIPLAPWESGQTISFGNLTYQGWEPGEIIFSNYEKIPHATANASWNSRPLLNITGIASLETIELLAFNIGDVYI